MGAKRSPSRRDPVEHVVHLEGQRRVGRRRPVVDLVPGDRRRHRRPGPGPQRVHRDGRLVPAVLAPVDEHLAGPHRLRHRRGHRVGVVPLAAPARRPGRTRAVLVGVRRVERHVDLQALRPRGLGERLEPEPLEHLADVERHLGALGDAGGRPGVEVEHAHRRRLDVVAPRHRRVDLERRHVGRPRQRGRRVEAAVADGAPLRSPGPTTVPIHSGRWDGQRFSKNDCPSTPLG